MRLAANLVRGLLLSFSATTALAQEIHLPPIEVGGQLTALGALGEGLHMLALVGPRVTVNLSHRNALEISADVMIPSFDRRRPPVPTVAKAVFRSAADRGLSRRLY